jgi:hypothetical protein
METDAEAEVHPTLVKSFTHPTSGTSDGQASLSRASPVCFGSGI